jgi:hypothetical protein
MEGITSNGCCQNGNRIKLVVKENVIESILESDAR